MKYSDRSKFPPIDYQNGIYLNGQVPLDERSVAATINDLYVNPSNRGASTLYGRAYVGMPVTIVETNQILICKNADPYTPGNSATTVNDDNFTTYWQPPLSEILSANAAGTGGGIDVSTLKSELTGQDIYSIGAKVDGTNIKIVNDKITGGSYKLTRVDSHTLEDGIWASYRLSYKGPDASSYTDLTDTQIDIPELDILEEVHICKATYDSVTGKYTETATDPADPSWETAAGDVYLHLIWKLSDQDSSKTTETYIKVGDMIKVDLTTINSRIKNLEDASNNVFGPRLNSCDASINALRQQISDTSTDFNTKLQNTSTYFEGLNTARVNDISTLRANTNSSLNDMNTTFTNSIANTKEELSGTISTVQTELNTKIDNTSSNLNSRVAEVSSGFNTLQTKVDASLG